eukprot:EG_transcript_27258
MERVGKHSDAESPRSPPTRRLTKPFTKRKPKAGQGRGVGHFQASMRRRPAALHPSTVSGLPAAWPSVRSTSCTIPGEPHTNTTAPCSINLRTSAACASRRCQT